MVFACSQYVTNWWNVKVVRMLASQSAHVEPEMDFIAQLEGAWEVSNFLVFVHSLDQFWSCLLTAEIVHIEGWVFFHDFPKECSCLFRPLTLEFALFQVWEACSFDCFWIACSPFCCIVGYRKQRGFFLFLAHDVDSFWVMHSYNVWVLEEDGVRAAFKDWFYQENFPFLFFRHRNWSN